LVINNFGKMNKKNIFYNVIKKENQFSQLLVNLVNENEELRKIIRNFFFGNLNIEFELFDTQLCFEDGKPDIIFLD
jgi:hypothetical protein